MFRNKILGILFSFLLLIPIQDGFAASSDTDHLNDRRVTATALDWFRQRVGQCWEIPPSARDATGLVVTLRFQLDIDGNLTSQPLVEQVTNHPAAEAAARSALAALIQCQPYNRMPKETHALWQDIRMKFDPSVMVGLSSSEIEGIGKQPGAEAKQIYDRVPQSQSNSSSSEPIFDEDSYWEQQKIIARNLPDDVRPTRMILDHECRWSETVGQSVNEQHAFVGISKRKLRRRVRIWMQGDQVRIRNQKKSCAARDRRAQAQGYANYADQKKQEALAKEQKRLEQERLARVEQEWKDTDASLTAEMHVLMQGREINELSRSEAAECVEIIDRMTIHYKNNHENSYTKAVLGDMVRVIKTVQKKCEKQASWFSFFN